MVSAMPPESPRQNLTVEELAKANGLSASTIHRLKNAGRIVFYQPAGPGGALRFPVDAIERSLTDPLPKPESAADQCRPQKENLSGPPPKWMTPTSQYKHDQETQCLENPEL